MMHPFTIHTDEAVLADLRQRLTDTRWPDELKGAGWEYGTNETYLKELCTYWATEFDWKTQETYLNSFQHFKTKIDGIGVHFIHHEGRGKTSVPILLTHGYPDSFVRFLKIIPLLTQADERGFSFDVVVPSIPGYGFSDRPAESGMNPKRIAGLFADLMQELGYDNFVAHGGDWGSSITENLALYHADSLMGIHLTDVPTQHALMPVDDPTAAEKNYLKQRQEWVTQTINSAIRIYHESMQALMQSQHNPLMKFNPFDKTGDKSKAPAAFALFPKDLSSPPQEFAERFFTVKRWTELPRGGHFTAMEEPELLADDLRTFVRQLTESA